MPCGGASSSNLGPSVEAPPVAWCTLPQEAPPGLSCCTLGQDVAQLSWKHSQLSAAAEGSKKLEDLYEFEKGAKPLGKGGFGMVFMARVKRDRCKMVAVKMMDKAKLRQMKAPPEMVSNEVGMMRECNGKDHFVQLYDYIETTSKHCLILEYCGHGTLQDAVMLTEGFLGEAQVRFLMQQILDGIAFLHSRSICHRDIKPHNYMMSPSPDIPSEFPRASRAASADAALLASSVGAPVLAAPLPVPRAVSTDNWPLRAPSPQQQAPSVDINAQPVVPSELQPPPLLMVKLGDFGTATKLPAGKLMRNKVGTPAFMAPELHLLPGRSPGYDTKVDVWAAGVVMVFLLANEYPFIDGSGRLLRHKLIMGDVPLWETGTFQNFLIGFQEAVGIRRKRPSKIARDLALHLLAPGRHDRVTASVALRHFWFRMPLLSEGVETDVRGAKLLDWKDFEEGLSVVGRDLQWAMDMMAGSLGTTVDDPLKTCVVCYNAAGGVGYVCPQCHHAVCAQCLQQLPKATCPYCRREASDMPLSKTVARLLQNPHATSDVTCAHAPVAAGPEKRPTPMRGGPCARGVVPV